VVKLLRNCSAVKLIFTEDGMWLIIITSCPAVFTSCDESIDSVKGFGIINLSAEIGGEIHR